jgi:hypothetical protein
MDRLVSARRRCARAEGPRATRPPAGGGRRPCGAWRAAEGARLDTGAGGWGAAWALRAMRRAVFRGGVCDGGGRRSERSPLDRLIAPRGGTQRYARPRRTAMRSAGQSAGAAPGADRRRGTRSVTGRDGRARVTDRARPTSRGSGHGAKRSHFPEGGPACARLRCMTFTNPARSASTGGRVPPGRRASRPREGPINISLACRRLPRGGRPPHTPG